MSPLQDYLQQVREVIATFPGAQVEQYRAELLTPSRANLRIRLGLPDDSLSQACREDGHGVRAPRASGSAR